MPEEQADFCECGEPATMWAADGTGYCDGCRWEYYERALAEGEPIRFRRNGDTQFIAYPLSMEGGILKVALLEVKPALVFWGPGFLQRIMAHIDEVRAREV